MCRLFSVELIAVFLLSFALKCSGQAAPSFAPSINIFAPVSPPTAEPTAEPTAIPTAPTPVPTFLPTMQPSRTFQPTHTPTNFIPDVLTYSVITLTAFSDFPGVNATLFQNDPVAIDAFKAFVATTLRGGVKAADVSILLINDTTMYDGRSIADPFARRLQGTININTGEGLTVADLNCSVSWQVSILAERYAESKSFNVISNTTAVYNSVVGVLASFWPFFYSNVAGSSTTFGNLKTATLTVLPEFSAEIKSAPTRSPTPRPTERTRSPTKDNQAVAIGVGVGIGLGVPLLCLIAALVYYFSCRKPAQKRTSRENLSPVGPTSNTA